VPLIQERKQSSTVCEQLNEIENMVLQEEEKDIKDSLQKAIDASMERPPSGTTIVDQPSLLDLLIPHQRCIS
jgi:hypothetical protein